MRNRTQTHADTHTHTRTRNGANTHDVWAAAAAAQAVVVHDVLPADPTRPCPFSWIPEDLRYTISQFVASDQASDFVVTTAQTVNRSSNMPLSALHDEHDLVLRGIPANGTLYITEVPDESDEIREVFNERTRQMVSDLGPWFAKIHRHVGGSIDKDRTPLRRRGAPRHRFFVEGTASHAVRLHISDAEYSVMNEWHDSSELRPATSRETAQMRTRLGQRRDALMQDDDMRFMKVSGASTKACDGQLIVLALCKALKIKAKLSILGTLPLMARLDLENPVDALSTMVHPWNLKSQMSYNLGKWLVLVPAKWLIGSQRRHNSFIVNDGFPTAIPSAGRSESGITITKRSSKTKTKVRVLPTSTASSNANPRDWSARSSTPGSWNTGTPPSRPSRR